LPTRTVSSTLLLVLLTSALFISVYSVVVPTPVQAATVTLNSLNLFPNIGPPGQWVFVTGILNKTLTSGSCSFTASSPNLISSASPGFCSVSGNTIIGSFKVTAPEEISVSKQLPGMAYQVGVTVVATGVTYLSANSTRFTVTPRIGFSHTGAAPWEASKIVMSVQTVYVHGWGYNASSVFCSYRNATGTTDPVGTLITAPSCSINAGELSGQFTMMGGAGKTVYINATGNHKNENATGALSIVSGPAIQVTPGWASRGMTVTVTGIGFSLSDTSFVLSYLNLTFGQLYTSTSAWTINTVGTWKQPSVTFVVASTATPKSDYTLRVMGLLTGDYAYAHFIVNATPAIGLNPATGPPGQTVLVTNSTAFSSTDAGLCTMSTTPSSPVLISSYICIINPDGGLNAVTSFFVSSSTPGGGYMVRVTGSSGDYAETAFVATTTRSVTLTPNSGSGGDTIQVNGLKFSLGDTACTISTTNPSGSVNAVLSYSCSVSSGTVTGSFVIKTLDTPAGVYNITVTGNTGDWGSALLTVNPKITLTPSTARVGDNVTVTGSNLAAADKDKFINFYSVPIGGVNTTVGYSHGGLVSSNFTLSAGSSFIVASNPTLSSYTITGNFTKYAQAILTVTSRIVLLSPNYGPVGTWVNVTGTGFSTSDTVCAITGNDVVLSPTCSIGSGNLRGLFQVKSGATLGTHPLNVTGYPRGDRVGASFLVTPAITLNPSSGHPGTIVSVLGSGFSTTDTSCTISSSPSGLISNPICAAAGGNVAGTFTVASGATGAYTVIVTGTGLDAAYAPFNRATPTLTLSPESGVVGTTVTASGGNYQGTACMLTALPSNLFISQACTIIAGNLTGSFTVASGASAGYTVYAQTNAGLGDSASALFSVTGVTTTVTTLTSTSTATTTPTTTAMTTVTPTTTVQTTSSVVSTSTATSVVTSTGPWTPPKCVIATATFGSEASPAVQFLRNFRDRLVLSTTAGSAFMQVFNAWYYSFSPSVAQFIASNDPIRAPVRVLLYPLLGVLSISTFTYSLFSATPEFAIVMAGIVASSLIGLVYLTLPALVGMRSLRKRRSIAGISIARIAMGSLATALLLIAVGEFAQSFVLLAVGSSALVLTCIIAVPTLAARAILRLNTK